MKITAINNFYPSFRGTRDKGNLRNNKITNSEIKEFDKKETFYPNYAIIVPIVLNKGEKMETFELNLSMEELKKRTHKDYLMTKKFLKADAPEYLALAQGDKEALKHLCKASQILEKINMQIDCKYNLAFKNFLEKEIEKGNEQAKLTKILFDAQKGMNAIDSMSNQISLAKGITSKPGKGVYPEDLTKDEFHSILIKMLKAGKIEDVKNILNKLI